MHVGAVRSFSLKLQSLPQISALRFVIPRFQQLQTVRSYARRSLEESRSQSLVRPGTAILKSWVGKGTYGALSQTRRQNSQNQSYAQRSSAIGLEPGASSAVYSSKLDRSKVDVQIIDFNKDRLITHKLDGDLLEVFLQKQPMPSWSTCRWIYVNGVDQHTVECLGAHKNLHPLALEDVLDISTTAKVNWYENHCYLEMNMVKLTDSHHEPPSRNKTLLQHRAIDFDGSMQHMRSTTKFGISWEQVSAFLTDDNTIITFFETSGNDVLEPILHQLQSSQTVLRSSNDPSMLLHAIVDTVVDLSLPIDKEVAKIFDDLERAVLHNPNIPQSKQLHILRSGLTLLLNNTNAIGSLVKTLCDHRAVADLNNAANGSISSSANPLTSVQISAMARIYFHDVQDHVQTLSTSTHMSIRSAENLSSLIFNSITASQNESVRKLTLVSSFFLPLTFLTSYFGMNFDPMPSVSGSEAFFWAIAFPVGRTLGSFIDIC